MTDRPHSPNIVLVSLVAFVDILVEIIMHLWKSKLQMI